jgi:hypothetical protein
MRPTRLIGHLLLWTGFLYGVFVVVRRTEVVGDPWSTINWPAYGAALLIAAGGVVQLRLTSKPLDDGGITYAQNVDQLARLLERIRARIGQWQQRASELDVYEVHRRIDQELSDDLAAFADLRASLIDAFGLDHYAGIMTEFALAERTINRMWSASADGYIDEVRACLERAVAHLESAQVRLDTARAAQQTP